MRCELADICDYVNEKICVAVLDNNTYISTENMLPNRGGIMLASSLPAMKQTQAFCMDDILVSNIRPYFKKVWFATFDGGCSSDVLVFRAKDNISKKFLYYLLSDDKFFNYSMSTSKGTKMPRGDKSAIMKYEIMLPPLDVQEKITAILSPLDDKIELNRRINANLEQQAQAVFKHWFFDTDYRLGTVSEIIEYHDSKRIPLSSRERSTLAKIYPYYGATSVMDYVDRYIFDGVYLLLGEDGTVTDNRGFPILQYVDGKFWVNNHAHVITGRNGFSVELLYLLFSLTNVQSIVTGAVQPKISQASFSNLAVIIPPESELQKLDSIIQPFFAMIRNLKRENETLAQIRDSLLPKLISGEIEL